MAGTRNKQGKRGIRAGAERRLAGLLAQSALNPHAASAAMVRMPLPAGASALLFSRGIARNETTSPRRPPGTFDGFLAGRRVGRRILLARLAAAF